MLSKRTSIYFPFKMAEKRKNLRDQIIQEMIFIVCPFKNPLWNVIFNDPPEKKGSPTERMNRSENRVFVFIVAIIFSAITAWQ